MQGDERNQVDTFRLVLYIILIFLLLAPGNNNNSSNLRDSEEVKRMKEIRTNLLEKLDLDYSIIGNQSVKYAYNISGIYMGNWKRNNHINPTTNKNITLGAVQEIIRLESNSTIKGEEGLLSLQLYHRSYFRQNIDIIDGTLTLIEGEQDSSDDNFSLNLIGLYFVSTGNLVLYGNTYGSRFHVDWLSTRASSNYTIDNSFPGIVGYSVNGTNRVFLSAPSHLHGETTKSCFYSLNMQINDLAPDVDPEISHHAIRQYLVNGTGLLDSHNCHETLSLSIGGYNMDTQHISYKTRAYMVFAILVSFFECLLYISLFRQFINMSTYPAALGTVYLIAAIDLLLAMAHSLVGVFFMGILSELYFISFHKFFVFSVIEIRLLYMVWHSRHPDINANNIANFQRQLSLLYVSLYVLIIFTVILFFLKTHFVYVVLSFLFSFWVPQIARSLQLGQRSPFSVKQIVSITLLKLVIPVYLFCCPYNLVHSFKDLSLDYATGRRIIGWVLLQMILVIIQKVYNPYTILPPFLRPKKYDYHTIPNTDIEMDNTCAICMCEIDFTEKQEFMVAPCNHAFHTECLNQWMNVKLECPTCRSSLPDVRNL